MKQFAIDNNLTLSDDDRLNNVVIYYSNNGCVQSWIDHVLYSTSLDRLVCAVSVIDDMICSDHRPLSVFFAGSFVCGTIKNDAPASRIKTVKWENLSFYDIQLYQNVLDEHLKCIDLDPFLASCHCTDSCLLTRDQIDRLYGKIVDNLISACNLLCENRPVLSSNYCVLGCNDYVSGKHKIVRAVF